MALNILLHNDPHKKESANSNARWNVNFFIVTRDLIGRDSKTAKKLRFGGPLGRILL